MRKILFTLFLCFSFYGCSILLPFDCKYAYYEEIKEPITLINGVWEGNIISTQIGNFCTFDTVMNGAISVLIYEMDNCWFIWGTNTKIVKQ